MQCAARLSKPKSARRPPLGGQTGAHIPPGAESTVRLAPAIDREIIAQEPGTRMRIGRPVDKGGHGGPRDGVPIDRRHALRRLIFQRFARGGHLVLLRDPTRLARSAVVAFAQPRLQRGSRRAALVVITALELFADTVRVTAPDGEAGGGAAPVSG